MGLDCGILNHGRASLVMPHLSWSQRLPLYTAMGEVGTSAQANHDYGSAIQICLVMAHSFGKSITKEGWSLAEVNPIHQLQEAWTKTLDSIGELASEDNGAPSLPSPFNPFSDDSGLADNEEGEESIMIPDTEEEEENIDDVENRAPEVPAQPPASPSLSRRARRQLDPAASYVRLAKARL